MVFVRLVESLLNFQYGPYVAVFNLIPPTWRYHMRLMLLSSQLVYIAVVRAGQCKSTH
jgi:hypothetical protein